MQDARGISAGDEAATGSSGEPLRGDFMCNIVRYFRNACKAIIQIRQGEWLPCWNSISREHLTATRGNLTMWIGNGGWFCDIDESNYFGLICRQWVWWAAARKLKKSADSKMVAVL